MNIHENKHNTCVFSVLIYRDLKETKVTKEARIKGRQRLARVTYVLINIHKKHYLVNIHKNEHNTCVFLILIDRDHRETKVTRVTMERKDQRETKDGQDYLDYKVLLEHPVNLEKGEHGVRPAILDQG